MEGYLKIGCLTFSVGEGRVRYGKVIITNELAGNQIIPEMKHVLFSFFFFACL